MSDLTTYRKEVHDPHHRAGPFPEGSDKYIGTEAFTVYIPDDRLQAIADAWNDPLKPKTRASLRDGGMPELAVLLDALTKEDTDE